MTDAVRLRFQAPRRRRQREAEDSRRQTPVAGPAAATTVSDDSSSMPHTATQRKQNGLTNSTARRCTTQPAVSMVLYDT